jgi:hypothetical protein
MKRLLWLPLLLLGCSRDSDITVYRVPKTPGGAAQPALPSGHPSLEGGMPAGAPGGGGMDAPASTALAWTDPQGWKREAGSGMRVATYRLDGGVEVTVISLAGTGGGDLENVNRWRGQMGLPPAASLQGAVTEIPTGHGPAKLVEFDGAGPQAGKRMVAALKDEHGTTWFFKMTGPAAAVAKAKPGLVQLLGSLRHG